MGVTSDGRGSGCTFFFELPLYGSGHFDMAPPAPTPQPSAEQLEEPSRLCLFDRAPDSNHEDDASGSGPVFSLNDVVVPPSPTTVARHGGHSLLYVCPFQVVA
jgi:hypothetical protein